MIVEIQVQSDAEAMALRILFGDRVGIREDPGPELTMEPTVEVSKDVQLPEDNEDWERVGATLRAMREIRGFTAPEFASAIGISRSYLVNIEVGRKKLTPVLLSRSAAVLRVPQKSILAGDAS